MVLRPLSLLLVVALSLCSAWGVDAPPTAADRPPSGEAAMKLMRGHWILAHRDPDTSADTVSLVLDANGRLTLDEDYKTENGRVRITKKGKWWVEGGVAYGQFTESSQPDIAPVGYTTRDTILRLDEHVMELRTKEGDYELWERNAG